MKAGRSSPGIFGGGLARWWVPRPLRRVRPTPGTTTAAPTGAGAPAVPTRRPGGTPRRLLLPRCPTVRPRAVVPRPRPTPCCCVCLHVCVFWQFRVTRFVFVVLFTAVRGGTHFVYIFRFVSPRTSFRVCVGVFFWKWVVFECMRASGRASTGTIEMKIKKKNIRRKRKKSVKRVKKWTRWLDDPGQESGTGRTKDQT